MRKLSYSFIPMTEYRDPCSAWEQSEWKRISWDEALNILSERLTDVKDRFGPQAFAVAIGMPILLGGNTTVSFLRRFYGTPNCFSVESLCFRCRITGYILTLGK